MHTDEVPAKKRTRETPAKEPTEGTPKKECMEEALGKFAWKKPDKLA